MTDLAQARRAMVDNQIRTFDVTDRAVLAAFDAVPRHLFVPAAEKAAAYSDKRIGLGGGRSMLPPLILARLVQALQPQPGERALDLFGGLGYSSAILAAIGLEVTFGEPEASLATEAKAALANAGVAVTVGSVGVGDGTVTGLTGSFDLILVNGASEREPSGLFPLLNEGGRLGIILRRGAAAQAHIYLKANGVVSPRMAFDAQAPVLPGFALVPGFAF
jgi:protein-L-isoaspartate(D-aspartate) O-methyltransferase